MRTPAAIMCRREGYNGVVKEEFIVPPSLSPSFPISSVPVFLLPPGEGNTYGLGRQKCVVLSVNSILVQFIFRGHDTVKQAG